MARGAERHHGQSPDLPRADDAPALEPPGVAVERAQPDRTDSDTSKPTPSLSARMRRHPLIVMAAVGKTMGVVFDHRSSEERLPRLS